MILLETMNVGQIRIDETKIVTTRVDSYQGSDALYVQFMGVIGERFYTFRTKYQAQDAEYRLNNTRRR